MLKDYLQIRTLSIVFLGDFNPAIFQPFWLAEKKMIREQEAHDAKVDIIHNEITRIDLDWVKIDIQRNRFEMKTVQVPYFEPLRDLCVSIFEILKETPIKVLGINHIYAYALRDEATFFKFGNVLAPLDNWTEFMNEPRLLQIEIVENNRLDKLKGHYRIKIQPSEQKLATPFGLTININDQFSLAEGDQGRRGEIIDMLKRNWDNSFTRADSVTEKIWEKINK